MCDSFGGLSVSVSFVWMGLLGCWGDSRSILISALPPDPFVGSTVGSLSIYLIEGFGELSTMCSFEPSARSFSGTSAEGTPDEVFYHIDFLSDFYFSLFVLDSDSLVFYYSFGSLPPDGLVSCPWVVGFFCSPSCDGFTGAWRRFVV